MVFSGQSCIDEDEAAYRELTHRFGGPPPLVRLTVTPSIDHNQTSDTSFANGFLRRVKYLWRFLDSASAAFKGREGEERRMMEVEAAKALTKTGERKEKCKRKTGVGFVREVLGEDALDGARALLRNYDSNWEMKVEEREMVLHPTTPLDVGDMKQGAKK
ncbi:unnamed protein product [Ilex paraguariensis]|uniref:Uncharacterized protein n=1 Tax=Ilex paraguariensis TaxID=185542 RepID=A0ABC8RUP6_9AQUA